MAWKINPNTKKFLATWMIIINKPKISKDIWFCIKYQKKKNWPKLIIYKVKNLTLLKNKHRNSIKSNRYSKNCSYWISNWIFQSWITKLSSPFAHLYAQNSQKEPRRPEVFCIKIILSSFDSTKAPFMKKIKQSFHYHPSYGTALLPDRILSYAKMVYFGIFLKEFNAWLSNSLETLESE